MKSRLEQAIALTVLLIVIFMIGDAVFADTNSKRALRGPNGQEFFVDCEIWVRSVMSAKRTGWERYLDIVKKNVGDKPYEITIATDAAVFASISDDITPAGALLFCREESKRFWDREMSL